MDKQLIQRLAREAGFSVDMLGNLFVAEPDGTCGDEIDRLAALVAIECALIVDGESLRIEPDHRRAAAGIRKAFASTEEAPQPLQGMDHLFAKHADAAAEAAKQLVQERAGERRGLQYVCEVPGKFLDMTEHAGRLIILTESGVFELRPGETGLRQLQPMTPQDAAELDAHKQKAASPQHRGFPEWRYTADPFQFKKED